MLTARNDEDELGEGDLDLNLFSRPDERVMRRVTVKRCDDFLADARRRALADLTAAAFCAAWIA